MMPTARFTFNEEKKMKLRLTCNVVDCASLSLKFRRAFPKTQQKQLQKGKHENRGSEMIHFESSAFFITVQPPYWKEIAFIDMHR